MTSTAGAVPSPLMSANTWHLGLVSLILAADSLLNNSLSAKHTQRNNGLHGTHPLLDPSADTLCGHAHKNSHTVPDMPVHIFTSPYHAYYVCYLADTLFGSKLENVTRTLESFAKERPRMAAILYDVTRVKMVNVSIGGGFLPG